MKFRFCNDGDCPDWVLVEIHSTISVLTSIKLRTIAKLVCQHILDEEIPDEKLNKSVASKSAISCLRYLLINAAKYNTDEATFGAELQQLGLPKEHSLALCRVLSENLQKIRDKLYENRLQVDVLENINFSIPKDAIDCVQLHIKIKNEIINGISTKTTHHINVHRTDLKVLIAELKTIKQIMETYNYDKKYNLESRT